MIKGLHHVGIVTSDLEKAKRFYCGVFDFEIYSESEWKPENVVFNTIIGMEGSAAKFCMLKGVNTYLELFEFTEPHSSVDPAQLMPSDRGFRHLMFEVEDVHVVWEKVRQHGGIIMNAPVDVSGGPRVIYCRDPFGNLLELAEPAGRMPSLSAL